MGFSRSGAEWFIAEDVTFQSRAKWSSPGTAPRCLQRPSPARIRYRAMRRQRDPGPLAMLWISMAYASSATPRIGSTALTAHQTVQLAQSSVHRRPTSRARAAKCASSSPRCRRSVAADMTRNLSAAVEEPDDVFGGDEGQRAADERVGNRRARPAGSSPRACRYLFRSRTPFRSSA